MSIFLKLLWQSTLMPNFVSKGGSFFEKMPLKLLKFAYFIPKLGYRDKMAAVTVWMVQRASTIHVFWSYRIDWPMCQILFRKLDGFIGKYSAQVIFFSQSYLFGPKWWKIALPWKPTSSARGVPKICGVKRVVKLTLYAKFHYIRWISFRVIKKWYAYQNVADEWKQYTPLRSIIKFRILINFRAMHFLALREILTDDRVRDSVLFARKKFAQLNYHFLHFNFCALHSM